MPLYTVVIKSCVTVYDVEADTQEDADEMIRQDVLSRYPSEFNNVEIVE